MGKLVVALHISSNRVTYPELAARLSRDTPAKAACMKVSVARRPRRLACTSFICEEEDGGGEGDQEGRSKCFEVHCVRDLLNKVAETGGQLDLVCLEVDVQRVI